MTTAALVFGRTFFPSLATHEPSVFASGAEATEKSPRLPMSELFSRH